MAGYDHELSEIVAELNRAAPGSRAGRTESSETTATLDDLLGYAAGQGASDVVIIAGAQLMGILGMIICIPVAATLKVTINTVYQHLIDTRS